MAMTAQPDVLVLGEHPCTYLAAGLLRASSKLRVLHATIPGDNPPDRLVMVNPRLFDLHKLLGPLRRKVGGTPAYGLQFLGAQPGQRTEHRSKSIMAYVTGYRHMRGLMQKLATDQGVEMASPRRIEFHFLDENGLEISLGKSIIHPKVLVLGGNLPWGDQRLLGLPDSWGEGVLHRQSFLQLKLRGGPDGGARTTLPMSLDVDATLHWAWLLPCKGQVQVAVQQPVESLSRQPPKQLLEKWVQTLQRHGLLPEGIAAGAQPDWIDMPLAGALAHEGVANRALLIGPAGGFYSGSGEDIYPNCWSSVYAADVVKKALKEPHLQDALQPYRHRWRTTLGDYLRGPQQNLRFLLPLIYRNQVMTTRLAESILAGKSVVR
jgi:hypothetical protein